MEMNCIFKQQVGPMAKKKNKETLHYELVYLYVWLNLGKSNVIVHVDPMH